MQCVVRVKSAVLLRLRPRTDLGTYVWILGQDGKEHWHNIPSRTKDSSKRVGLSLDGGMCPFSRYRTNSALSSAMACIVRMMAPATTLTYHTGFSAFTWRPRNVRPGSLSGKQIQRKHSVVLKDLLKPSHATKLPLTT